MGDHPPITPCRAMSPHDSGGNSGRIFELIVRHFVATVSPDAVWSSTRVQLLVEPAGELFVAAARTLTFPGFMDVLVDRHDRYYEEEGDWAAQYMASDGSEAVAEQEEERALPDLQVGELFAVQGAETAPATAGRAMLSINEGMTSPPEHLTESELISIMERNGAHSTEMGLCMPSHSSYTVSL